MGFIGARTAKRITTSSRSSCSRRARTAELLRKGALIPVMEKLGIKLH